MPPMELRTAIEQEFDRWDAEFEEREAKLEKKFKDTADLNQRMQEEEAEIEKSLAETNEKFNTLLDLLDKDHVIVPSGKNLNSDNYPKIVGFGESIHHTAMRTLRLTSDFDAFRQLKGIEIPIDSLKRKVRVHFTEAELYVALGIRLDPSLEDKSAKAEYTKVITEGKPLYKELEKQGSNLLTRIRVAHDIAASHKRLYDLYEAAERSEKYGYHGDSEERHELIEEAREWYHKTFDISNTTESFDAKSIFPTDYEFKRYLADIKELEAGCVFQVLNQHRPVFQCQSPYRCFRENEGYCYYLHGTETHKTNLARVKDNRT